MSCCRELKVNIDESNLDRVINYIAKFDEYGLKIQDGGNSFHLIRYCPFCGNKLPESKRDLWFDTLIELGFEDPLVEEIPEEFKSSNWYKEKC